jgi:hypothetical protein
VRRSLFTGIVSLAGLLLAIGGLKLVASQSGPNVDPTAKLEPIGAAAGIDLTPPSIVGSNLVIHRGTVYEGEIAKGITKGNAKIIDIDLNGDSFNEVVASVTLNDGREFFFVQQFFGTETLTPFFGVGSASIEGTQLVTTGPGGTTKWTAHQANRKRIYGFSPDGATTPL